MDQKQFDALLSDAETRLRRLKVLYEQWFMGIERLEPGQARKEFEDLLARMRKEQTNNTAQRFRLQQLVQRHITLSTHWRRVGRQIEEGTFQRDVLRAKRRKQHEQARDADEPDLDVTYDVEVDEDLAAALAEADRLAHEPPPSPPAPDAAFAGKRGRTTAGIGPSMPLTAAESVRPPLQPAAAPAAHSLTPFAIPGADGLRSKPPTPSTAPAAPAPLIKQTLGRGAPPPPAAATARTATLAGTRAGPPATPGDLLGTVASPRVSAAGAAGPQAGSPARAVPPATPGSAGRSPPSPPGAAAPQGAASRAAVPGAAARPAPAVRVSKAQLPPVGAGPSKPAAAPGGAAISAQDIDRVYNQYVAARGRNAERTDNVKRETIEKTIRGMLPQLEQKHAGKKIDFEVVVKDGRVALKPVAK